MNFNRTKEKEKKLKSLFVFGFTMLTALCLNAQVTYPNINVGAKVGMNRSNIIAVDANSIFGNLLVEPIYGYQFGAIGELAIFKKLGIQGEIILSRKGFENILLNRREYHDMLDIPILAKFSNLDDFDAFSGYLDSENINASFLIGPYISMSRKLMTVSNGIKRKYKLKDTFLAGSTWGFQVAASTEYNVSGLGIVGLQFGAQLALKDIDVRDEYTKTSFNYYLSIHFYPQLKKIFSNTKN